MRIFLSKLLISAYLLLVVYKYAGDAILFEGMQRILSENINELQIDKANKEFLHLYLMKSTLFCLGVSFISLFSKNVLPKMFMIAGVALWAAFTVHFASPLDMKISVYTEHLLIIGGILYIAGSESFP